MIPGLVITAAAFHYFCVIHSNLQLPMVGVEWSVNRYKPTMGTLMKTLLHPNLRDLFIFFFFEWPN